MSVMIDNPHRLAQIQNHLKQLSDEELAMQMKDPSVPPYMIDAEDARRKALQQGQSGMAAPPGSMREETGYAQGGIVKLAEGGGEWGDPWRKTGTWLGEAYDTASKAVANRVPQNWSEYYQAFYGGTPERLQTATPTAAATSAPAATPKRETEQEKPPVAPQTGGAGGGGGAGIGGMSLGPGGKIDIPEARDEAYYASRRGPAPVQKVSTLDEAAPQAEAYTKKYGYDFTPQQQEQATRRTELDTLKGENRNMALLQAGLGMMSAEGPNAVANIGKGAMKGADYLTKAKELERREMQAIRDGDFKLAQAIHGQKMEMMQLSSTELQRKNEAEFRGQGLEYQGRQADVKSSEESAARRAQTQATQIQLDQARDIANLNARVALEGHKARGAGERWTVDRTRLAKAVDGYMENKNALKADLVANPPKSKDDPRLGEWNRWSKLSYADQQLEAGQVMYPVIARTGGGVERSDLTHQPGLPYAADVNYENQ